MRGRSVVRSAAELTTHLDAKTMNDSIESQIVALIDGVRIKRREAVSEVSKHILDGELAGLRKVLRIVRLAARGEIAQ